MFSDLGKHMGRKGAALTALAVFLAATVIPLVACAISLAVDVYSVPGLVLVLYSSLVGAMALVVTFKYPRWSTIVYLFLLDVLCIAVINEIIWFFVSRSMAEGGILLMDLVPSLVFLLVGSGLACALRAVGERTSPSNPPYREDIKHLAVWALTGQDESAEDGSGKKGFAAAGKVLSAAFSTVRTAPCGLLRPLADSGSSGHVPCRAALRGLDEIRAAPAASVHRSASAGGLFFDPHGRPS